MPYSLVLERASGTHTNSVQPKLSLLTSTCSVVYLLPQVQFNKLRLAALEVLRFHSLWCLGAQRKGMVIYMFDLDLQSRTPIYEQLYKKTIELIIKGVLKENEQLPSVRSLAKEIGVNPNTVAKAYQELERNKIIYSVSGRGSFIAKICDSSVKDYILEDFDHSVYEAVKIGITKDELKERIDGVEL